MVINDIRSQLELTDRLWPVWIYRISDKKIKVGCIGVHCLPLTADFQKSKLLLCAKLIYVSTAWMNICNWMIILQLVC